MVTITLDARQQKRHRCIEQSFGLCGKGRGVMIWENGIETCIISYKKRIASPGLIMASSPITSWEIDGETVETVADFIFLGSKITADGDCSHEIKRHLLLGRKL